MEILFEFLFDIVFGLLGALFSSIFHSLFPKAKMKLPPAGKLPGYLSPKLKEFLQELPRPAGDPLAAVCVPVDPKGLTKVPLRLKFLFPLWKCGNECFAVWQTRGVRAHPQFGLFFPKKRATRTMSFRGSEQGMLAVLLARVLEHQDWSDPDRAVANARLAAGATGYRFADETIQWFRERHEARIYDREFDVEQFATEIAKREQGQ